MKIDEVRKVAIAGGGVLGSQIAFQSAYQGYEVTVWLRSEGSIGRAKPKFETLHKRYLATIDAMIANPAAYAYGIIAKEDATKENLEAQKEKVDAAFNNIVLTTDWDEAFGDADLVIEAVAEDPKQKVEFYTELAKHLPEKTVIATNSSTLLPSMFAEATGRPEKFLALHFANEIWKNPTGEVMGHAGTAQENFDLIVEFAKKIRMIPLKVLKEQPGYLLNSMLVPLLSAAEALWANGVGSIEDIDRAWTIGTGAPAGPFRILDIVGITTAYNVVSLSPEAKVEGTTQYKIATNLKKMIDEGKLGVASGEGFYKYN